MFFFLNLTICDNQNIKLLLSGTLITSKLQIIFTKNWCFLSVSWNQCLFLLFELFGKESTYSAGDPCLISWIWKIPWRRKGLPIQVLLGFPGAQMVNNLPTMQETWIITLGWEDSLEREWLPTPEFLLGEFPAGYTSWCHKESYMTKRLSFSITRELVWPLLGWEWLASRKSRLSLQTLWWASWLTPSNYCHHLQVNGRIPVLTTDLTSKRISLD